MTDIDIHAVLAELRAIVGAQAVDLAVARAHIAQLTAELEPVRAATAALDARALGSQV